MIRKHCLYLKSSGHKQLGVNLQTLWSSCWEPWRTTSASALWNLLNNPSFRIIVAALFCRVVMQPPLLDFALGLRIGLSWDYRWGSVGQTGPLSLTIVLQSPRDHHGNHCNIQYASSNTLWRNKLNLEASFIYFAAIIISCITCCLFCWSHANKTTLKLQRFL